MSEYSIGAIDHNHRCFGCGDKLPCRVKTPCSMFQGDFCDPCNATEDFPIVLWQAGKFEGLVRELLCPLCKKELHAQFRGASCASCKKRFFYPKKPLRSK